ncbi:hypothetical protein KP509_29G030600 [Ceratopteris richardii]|nr:hypothetical protein KP509_29G030600 [Ceratopteris richardii]
MPLFPDIELSSFTIKRRELQGQLLLLAQRERERERERERGQPGRAKVKDGEMTRAFVVAEVHASHISPDFRKCKHLDVVPYVTFATQVGNFLRRPSMHADQGLHETHYSDQRDWKGPFIIPLNQAVETPEESVVVGLHLKRSLRDKLVAKLQVPTGDFGTTKVSNIYEMTFVKEKFHARNANRSISLQITGWIEDVDWKEEVPSPKHRVYNTEVLKKVAQGLG